MPDFLTPALTSILWVKDSLDYLACVEISRFMLKFVKDEQGTLHSDRLLWQHSHRSRIDGIDGDVDLNTFNGDSLSREQWLTEFGD